MTISQRIFFLLKQKHKKQKDLAEFTGISTSAISAWNKNNTNPAAESLSIIADFLEVSLDFLITGEDKPMLLETDEIKKLLNNYNSVDEMSKKLIQERAATLAELAAERAAQEAEKISKEKYKTAETKPITVAPAADEEPEEDEEFYIDLCNLPVSAGTGVYLDEGFTEPLQIKRTVTAERANYAIRVSGNSMEPKFYDGDIVLVETCPSVEIGEIGIFIVNGEGYIKKRGQNRLISLNPKAKDVILHEDDTIYCRGRVLGKAEIIE